MPLVTKITPKPGMLGWINRIPQYGIPAGLPDRSPVRVVGEDGAFVVVQTQDRQVWRVYLGAQVDCGPTYGIADNGSQTPESHPAVQQWFRSHVEEMRAALADPELEKTSPVMVDNHRASIDRCLWIIERNLKPHPMAL